MLGFRVVTIGFLTFLTVFIQYGMFPDAGKTISDKTYEYSFQANYWEERIHKKFDNIVESGLWPKIALHKQEITIDDEYFSAVVEYKPLLQRFYEVVRYNGEVGANIIYDMGGLIPKGLLALPEEHREEISRFLSEYKDKQKAYFERSNVPQELENRLRSLNKTEYPDQADWLVARHRLIVELYKNEAYHLNGNVDSFRFVREFAELTNVALLHYQSLLEVYNEEVSFELNLKISCLLFIALMIMGLTVAKDEALIRFKNHLLIKSKSIAE